MLTNNSTDYILESILKEILSDMLQLLEQNIRSEEELQLISDQLQDYESLQQLALTMKFIFNSLKKKFQGTNNQQKFFRCEQKSENYDKLEQAVQKQEQEIRIHIRTQHEMKIYIDTIQQQLEESEQIRKEYLEETTQMIQKLKKENYNLIQQLKYYTQNYKQQTVQNSRRDSAQTINQILQKQSSKSNHIGNNLEKQEQYLKQQFKSIIKKQGFLEIVSLETSIIKSKQKLLGRNKQIEHHQQQLYLKINTVQKSIQQNICKDQFITLFKLTKQTITQQKIKKISQFSILEQTSKRKSLHAESHRSKGFTDQQKLSNK